MKAILALTVALAATAVFARTHVGHKHAAPVVPTFPLDWTANEVDYMVVYQGQYEVQNGAYCCGDASCEVQTQFQSGMDYYDYTHNRTRFNDPVNGDIVSLYYPTYKEMAVDATNTCQEYCPIEDDIEPYGLDPNSTYMGQKTINGVLYSDWQYKDVEFGVVFETDDVYVNSKNLPYQEVDQLTPFGEAIGLSTSTYNTFTPGTPDASLFDIKNVENCPESQNCGSDQRQFVRRRWKLRQTWMKHYQAANLAKAEAIMRAMKH